jgi:hypothetical protein
MPASSEEVLGVNRVGPGKLPHDGRSIEIHVLIDIANQVVRLEHLFEAQAVSVPLVRSRREISLRNCLGYENAQSGQLIE